MNENGVHLLIRCVAVGVPLELLLVYEVERMGLQIVRDRQIRRVRWE